MKTQYEYDLRRWTLPILSYQKFMGTDCSHGDGILPRDHTFVESLQEHGREGWKACHMRFYEDRIPWFDRILRVKPRQWVEVWFVRERKTL